MPTTTFFRQSLNNMEGVLLSEDFSANYHKQKHGLSSKLKETQGSLSVGTVPVANGTSKSPHADLGFY